MLLSKEFLELVWQHGMSSLQGSMTTTDGEIIEVLSAGFRSDGSEKPEFSHASIRFVDSGVTLHGSVKVDSLSSDWRQQGTVSNKAFDNVVLHFVGQCDLRIMQRDHLAVTVVADVPQYLVDCAHNLQCDCEREFYVMEDVYRENFLSRLTTERLARKSREIIEIWESVGGDWPNTAMITLFRSLGYRATKPVYEALGRAIPYYVIRDRACDLQELEAMLLATAGYLEGGGFSDEYMWRLRDIHAMQCEQYRLSSRVVMPVRLKVRPQSYPQLQLARIAAILHNELSLFERLTNETDYANVRRMFRAQLGEYWQSHSALGEPCDKGSTMISEDRIDLFIINFVVPFLHAYGQFVKDEEIKERAVDFLIATVSEQNKYTRKWSKDGYFPANAYYSQGLVQLSTEYCEARGGRCLACPFGSHFLLDAYKKYLKGVRSL